MIDHKKITFIKRTTGTGVDIAAGLNLRSTVTFQDAALTPELQTLIGKHLCRNIWQGVYNEPLQALIVALRELKDKAQGPHWSHAEIDQALQPIIEMLSPKP